MDVHTFYKYLFSVNIDYKQIDAFVLIFVEIKKCNRLIISNILLVAYLITM